MWVGNRCRHEGNGVLDGSELCVEVILSEGGGANWRAEEAETIREFDGKSGAEDVIGVGFGGVFSDRGGDGRGELWVGEAECGDW